MLKSEHSKVSQEKISSKEKLFRQKMLYANYYTNIFMKYWGRLSRLTVDTSVFDLRTTRMPFASIPSTKIFPTHATPSVQLDLSCLVGFTRLLVYFRDGTSSIKCIMEYRIANHMTLFDCFLLTL